MSYIDKLIINSPYTEPKEHWFFDGSQGKFVRREGRRSAGYTIAAPHSHSMNYHDAGQFVAIELVNTIRSRVKSWREANYPGVTGITRRLLEHWHHLELREYRFFFCQLEAIETLIWLTESPPTDRVGLDIRGDGGNFERWCSKMATGSGKTIVMSMIIAWNFLNKMIYPKDRRFSKYALVVAPGLTVKDRLQVLHPDHTQNYYTAFDIVPSDLMESLRQGRVLILNWHALAWDTQEKINAKINKKTLCSVDKRNYREISNTAYVRKVLGEMSKAKNMIVLNDEAHHAWRVNPEAAGKYRRIGKDTDAAEEATIWIGGLDKVHKATRILRCYDLSATPFAPSGKQTSEEVLFNWIVSDFGLNDAIESGLVKTPRIPFQDDGKMSKEYRSRLYHIYNDEEVKDNINRKATESEPLPDLLTNAYNLLGADWKKKKKEWEHAGHKMPPVMITVANRTETSARIKYTFDRESIDVPELWDPEKTLQIDTKVLQQAESETESISANEHETSKENTSQKSKKEWAEYLRQQVNTIGKEGGPGGHIQHIISVGMLSEGWDANTVTHVMGLRAFSSQLLCEQVVGRGLRRVSYEVGDDGLLPPEYVKIFGIPFAFLPHEGDENTVPVSDTPKVRIEPVKEKEAYAIKWPNVERIDFVYHSDLQVNGQQMEGLEIDAPKLITEVELAAIIDGKPNLKIKESIGLENMQDIRLQTLMFHIARTIYDTEDWKEWKSSQTIFFAQLVRIVEIFITSGKIRTKHELYPRGDLKWMVMLVLSKTKIAEHIRSQIKISNTEKCVPIFHKARPVCSTKEQRAWYTSKPCTWTEKSHINYCVYDSRWEAEEAYILDKSKRVHSFVKNDHLGFAIFYNYQGQVRRYYPDFIICLINQEYVILEVKGKLHEEDKNKRKALQAWVRAVNNYGSFGKWHEVVSSDPADLKKILNQFFTYEKVA